MEKAKQLLELTRDESEAVEKLPVRPKKAGESCFYTFFALRGIRVDRVEPGLVVCTFKVPPRLTDRSGKLASGAIANLVDEVGSAVIYDESLPEPVSVDMSISYMSTADVDDELEITSRLLGQKGRYSGTSVIVKNKTSGEIVAEGRHSLFSIRATPNSKLCRKLERSKEIGKVQGIGKIQGIENLLEKWFAPSTIKGACDFGFKVFQLDTL